MIKKGQLYKGFRCLDVVEVSECNATGFWLRHEESGMEVLHLLNEDDENLFSFCFRTPSQDGTGCAHVLEHSVLCGSKKYPLKDPMWAMANQSVNTFLNAFTHYDHTVYPAASYVKADYFNLMSVYADAVFFPLLRPEVFSQECHRIEYDENGKPSVQGVVYNEMKGAYSDFDCVCDNIMVNTSLKGTSYGHDSGGDPSEIPYLTHSKFKAFHRKFYNPANCLVFLCGNIPTEEQLDFLNQNIFKENPTNGKAVKWESFPKDFSMESSIKAYGPAGSNTDTSKAQVNLLWLMSKDLKDRVRVNMENVFLSHLLWGSSSAPLRKALMESGLGTDMSPCCGYNPDMLFTENCVGLNGVNPSDAKKVKKLVFEVLEDICKNGISKEDLERTAMAFKFSNKEIRRGSGPYSMVYMNRAFRGWIYGINPFEALRFNEEFEVLYNKIKTDSDYLSKIIRRYFLDNKDFTLYTLLPSSSWSKKRAKLEKDYIKETIEHSSKEKVLKEVQKMHEFQNREVTDEENNLIPRIGISDLDTNIPKISTASTEVDGVRCFFNKQPTNGILYFEVMFPCDILPAKEYPFLQIFAMSATRMGWKDLSWDKATSTVQSKTGGMSCSIRTVSVPEESVHLMTETDYVGRDWVVYGISVLEENMQDAFNLMADCITGTRFDDKKHLKDLLTSTWNGISSSIINNAHVYASSRCRCLLNRNSAISEIFYGLTALNTMKNLIKADMSELGFHLRSILAKIRKGGAIIHVTGTASGISGAKKIIPSFIKKCSLKSLAPKYNSKDADFFKLTVIPGESKKLSKKIDMVIDELIEVPGTVGFTAMAMPGSGFGTKESIAEMLFASSFGKTDLYHQIRSVGGAYSVMYFTDAMNHSNCFITYRDPKPYESNFVFRESIAKVSEKKVMQEDVERSIIGSYSDMMVPQTPSSMGDYAMYMILSGINESYKKKKLKWLLGLKAKDIEQASKRLSLASENHRICIICGSELISAKMKENSRKIIELPI